MDNKTKPKRLLALDIMRGITIAGMLLVNNPGSWGSIYTPLRHAEWHGLTPTDLVFPFFMFIMGVSTWFSLKKYNFEFSAASLRKVLRRTVVIFAIGLGIAWLAKSTVRHTRRPPDMGYNDRLQPHTCAGSDASPGSVLLRGLDTCHAAAAQGPGPDHRRSAGAVQHTADCRQRL